MKNFLKEHPRAIVAVSATVLIWVGIMLSYGLPQTLIGTGILALFGTAVSYLPD